MDTLAHSTHTHTVPTSESPGCCCSVMRALAVLGLDIMSAFEVTLLPRECRLRTPAPAPPAEEGGERGDGSSGVSLGSGGSSDTLRGLVEEEGGGGRGDSLWKALFGRRSSSGTWSTALSSVRMISNT